MKQPRVLGLVVLIGVLGSCSSPPPAATIDPPIERLSTEDSCSEFEAVLALENEDVVTEGTADQVGEQMSLLAAVASTVISEDIELTADMSKGVYGTSGEVQADKELQGEYDAALSRLGRVCDIDWLKDL